MANTDIIYDCPGAGCDVALRIISFSGRTPALVPCMRCIAAEQTTERSLTRPNGRCMTCGGHFRRGDHERCADNEARQLQGAA